VKAVYCWMFHSWLLHDACRFVLASWLNGRATATEAKLRRWKSCILMNGGMGAREILLNTLTIESFKEKKGMSESMDGVGTG